MTVVVVASHYAEARQSLSNDIRVLELPYNDCWMRDIGATYVVNDKGDRRAVSWQFNAWGGALDGLYTPWDLDDAMATSMATITDDDYYQAPFFLEGGSIHSDGEGTLYTTQECLLHPSRNPDLSKSDIERLLASYLNIKKVIWLTEGLFNDETNGHIDNIMHVVRPGVVTLTWCDDENDPQYAISRAAYAVLSQTTDAKGRIIEIIKLPLPGPLYIRNTESQGIQQTIGMERQTGDRLAASYANFLICNQLVIFPLLDTKTDANAQQVLATAFPDYQLIGIPAREILLGGGNIHCITQQVPRTL